VRSGPLWLAAAALIASSVVAQDGPELSIRHAAGGVHRPGGTLALAVRLHNDSAVDTVLRIEYDSTPHVLFRRVELPAGTRKALTFYIDGAGYESVYDVVVKRDASGAELGEVQITSRPLLAEQTAVGIVGDHSLGFGDLAASDAYQPAFLRPGDLPSRVAGLRALDVIAWVDPRPADLRPEQAEALTRWVDEGGILLLAVDETWLDLSSGVLERWTSVRARAPVPVSRLDALGRAAGSVLPPFDPPQSVVALEPRGATVWLRDEPGVLGTIERRGRGRVVVFGVNPSRVPLSSWNGWAALWIALLDATGYEPHPSEDPQPDVRAQTLDVRREAGALLTSEHEVRPPSRGLLLLLFALYLAAIGPLDYLLLRRKGKLAWTWITLPLIVGLVALGSYGVAAGARSADARLDHLVLRDLSPEDDRRSDTVFAAFFAPRQGPYAMSALDPAMIALPVATTPTFDPRMTFVPPVFGAADQRAFGQASGVVAGVVPKWSYLSARFVGDGPGRGARVDARLMLERGVLSGTILAELGSDLEHAWLLVVDDGPPRVFDLGPLQHGEPRSIDLEGDGLVPEKTWRLTMRGAESGSSFASVLMTATARRAFADGLDPGSLDWRKQVTAGATLPDPHAHLDWSRWLAEGGGALIGWAPDTEPRVEIRDVDVEGRGVVFWRIPIPAEVIRR
jgi:hypothetical protein